MKMEKIYKKRFLNKLIILTVLLLAPIASSAEVGDEKWTKECDKKNKKVCVIAINKQIAIPNSDKKQTLATVLIQLASTTDKLEEKNKPIPVLVIRFPLNVDLKKQPLIQIDKKNVLNIPFSHCNAKEGCVTSVAIADDVVGLFKSGKELTLIMAPYGGKDNITINLPLKGFSKAYDRLVK